MTVFRDRRGRLRVGWRVGLFFVAVLAVLIALQLLLALLPLPVRGGTGIFVGGVFAALAALGASWLLVEKIEGLPLASLGLPLDGLTAGEVGRGFLVGAVVMSAALLLLAATGGVGWVGAPAGPVEVAWAFLRLTAFLLVAAWAEEVLLRGYPLQAIAEKYGGVVAIVATSAAFAVLHGANPGLGSNLLDGLDPLELLPLLNIGLAGVLLGVAYWRTYSLWFATGVHAGWNWVMGFAADLPVSGLEAGSAGYGFFDTPGIEAVVEGERIWTGGSFGPEGGLAVTAVTLVAVLWMARTGRLSRSLRVRALRPLPDRRVPAADDHRDERRGP